MCARHHTHCPVESVVERGAAAPSLSSVCGRVRQGVKFEQRTCLSRTSRIGGTVRDGVKAWTSETPTAQYIIYNTVKMGLFKSVCHPAKTDPAERALTLSLPPPVPTRKNHPHPTQMRRGARSVVHFQDSRF
jgi:hypothetical protein